MQHLNLLVWARMNATERKWMSPIYATCQVPHRWGLLEKPALAGEMDGY